MRILSISAAGLAALVLAGCVAQTPLPGTVPATPAPQPAQPTNILDAASRQVARNVISTEMEKRLPGVNVSPYTDCVVNNASTDELIGIATAARGNGTGMADTVAAIVSRPGTSQCIKGAAITA